MPMELKYNIQHIMYLFIFYYYFTNLKFKFLIVSVFGYVGGVRGGGKAAASIAINPVPFGTVETARTYSLSIAG